MMQFFPLSEGEFTVGHDKVLLPFDKSKQDLNDRAKGSLHIEVQPFLVITDDDLIVLDCGLGLKDQSGGLQIQNNIIAAGFEPSAVTKVLVSHLHKDHSGGMVFQDERGMTHAMFPNATYYLYRPEVDFALKTGAPSYIAQDIEVMLQTVNICWLEGEEGLIDGYIRFIHSGGHCPQHIVFIIENGGKTVFYGGDEAPQLKQMQMRYIAKYDFDGKKALAIREKYALLGRQNGWYFLFYHDVTNAIAQLGA